MKNLMPLIHIILILSCSGSGNVGNTPESSDPVLTDITISSSSGNQLDLNVTNTTTLSASGIDQYGELITIQNALQWESNNNNVNVDQNGIVSAQSTGSSTITVTSGTITSTINLIIIDSSPVTGTYIYVSDAANFNTGPWKIYKYDENGQNAEVFIDEGLGWPQDILFLENENEVLITNLTTGTINRHNATTGALINSFATGISGPTRMIVGEDNLLYVLQWSGNGLVLRYELDGNFVDQFTNVSVSQSIGLDWDSSGNLYVSSYDGLTVRKFDSNGNDMGIFINSNLQGPTNIWFDEDDNLFVCDWTGGKVVKYNSSGTFIENFITGLNQVEGVDFLPNGNILLGNGNTSEVKLYDENGNFVQNLVSAGAGGLIRPNAVRIREIN